MAMFSDFLSFAAAVADHWILLVSGSFITVFIALYERYKSPVRRIIYGWIMVITMLLACFLAWRDEYAKNNDLTQQITALLKPSFVVEFSDDANIRPSYPSEYVTVVNIGVAGDLLDNFISRHTFMFKLTNTSLLTARNVEAYVTRIIYNNIDAYNIHEPLILIPPDRSRDLKPLDVMMVQFLEFLDERSAALLVKHVDKDTLNSLILYAKRGFSTATPMGFAGFATPALGKEGLIKQIKGSSLSLEIIITADNLIPIYVQFSVAGPEPYTIQITKQGALSTK
jgi:hypothetical protein